MMRWVWIFTIGWHLGISQLIITDIKQFSFGPEITDELVSIIALEEIKGLPTLKIKQREGIYILDTGAPGLVLNDKINAPVIVATGLSKDIAVGQVLLKNFQWAGKTYSSYQALLVDLQHLSNALDRTIAGLIGFDLFKTNEVLIDGIHHQLTILPAKPNALHKLASPKQILDFQLQGHLPVIKMNIDGQQLFFGLDTGSASNLIDNSLADLIVLESEECAEFQSLDKEVLQLSKGQLNGRNYQKELIRDNSFLLIDLKKLNQNTELNIDGLLGYPFFKGRKISIDYPNHKIYIWD